MFSQNVIIEDSLKIMNAVEDSKFPLLLSRIAQFLLSGAEGKPFTSVEEEKLENSLGVTKHEVQILTNGIIELFQICAYYVIKPTVLLEKLNENLPELSYKKKEILVQVWSTFAKGIVENLKQKACFQQLNHMSYSVSVEGASNNSSREKSPKAQLQLCLMSSNKRKDINLEFNHEQLYGFYKKLEQIQEQLDSFN